MWEDGEGGEPSVVKWMEASGSLEEREMVRGVLLVLPEGVTKRRGASTMSMVMVPVEVAPLESRARKSKEV